MSEEAVTAPTTKEARELALAQAEKFRREAAKAAAESEHVRNEEKRAAERHAVDLRVSQAGADISDANKRVAQIQARNIEREEQQELARDRHNNVYNFNQSVSGTSVRDCITQLTQWVRTGAENVEIIFDSPGGSVIDGMHLFDFVQWVRSKGVHVTTVAMGMAASMAGILLQAGDKRVMGRESYVLIHEISFGAGGKIGEIEDEVAFVKKIQGRVLDIFAAKSAQTLKLQFPEKYDLVSLKDLTRQRRSFFKRGWERKDWWLDSEECIREGVVDDVR